jgi:hypothetical protein
VPPPWASVAGAHRDRERGSRAVGVGRARAGARRRAPGISDLARSHAHRGTPDRSAW